jgi:transcriptional regulator with XRE-family HTH domain
MILHEILTERGIPGPSELGRQLGVSKQHAWLLWHGTVLPGPELLRKLRDQLQIPIEQLLELERAVPLKRRGRRPSHYQPARGGHAPGPLRDAFLGWLEESIQLLPEVPLPATVEVEGEPRPVAWLFGQLWNCTDALPGHAVEQINDWLTSEGLPPIDRHTYASAMRALKPLVSADEGPAHE